MKNSVRVCDSAKRLLVLLVLCCVMVGCASIDVSRNSAAIYSPTDVNTVALLKVTPYRGYEEIATFTVTGFSSTQVDTMHYAMRQRAATLGADAVVLTGESLVPSDWGGYDLLGKAIAIRYTGAPS